MCGAMPTSTLMNPSPSPSIDLTKLFMFYCQMTGEVPMNPLMGEAARGVPMNGAVPTTNFFDNEFSIQI